MTEKIRQTCLSFPEVTESPHFHKTSFRVNKKIFATLDNDKEQLVVKLSPIDQSVFTDMLQDVVTAVPGGWGKKGWTVIYLRNISVDPLMDLLRTAYKEVAPDRLANLI